MKMKRILIATILILTTQHTILGMHRTKRKRAIVQNQHPAKRVKVTPKTSPLMKNESLHNGCTRIVAQNINNISDFNKLQLPDMFKTRVMYQIIFGNKVLTLAQKYTLLHAFIIQMQNATPRDNLTELHQSALLWLKNYYLSTLQPLTLDQLFGNKKPSFQYNGFTAQPFFGINTTVNQATGNALLHRAAVNAPLFVLKKLIAHGANINAINNQGHTPLSLAIFHGNINAVKLLLKITKKHPLSLLHVAVSGGHKNMIKYLIDHGFNSKQLDSSGSTILHMACTCGKTKLIDYLTTLGLRVDTRDQNSNNSLDLAVMNGHVTTANKIIQTNSTLVNAIDQNNETALLKAIDTNQLETVKTLLKNNANPNMQNSAGETSLHMAVTHLNSELVKLLLTHNAQHAVRNNNNETPLDKAHQILLTLQGSSYFDELFNAMKINACKDIIVQLNALDPGQIELLPDIIEEPFLNELHNDVLIHAPIEMPNQNQNNNVLGSDTDEESFDFTMLQNSSDDETFF